MVNHKESKLDGLLSGLVRKNNLELTGTKHEETQFSASDLEQHYQALQRQNSGNAPAPGQLGVQNQTNAQSQPNAQVQPNAQAQPNAQTQPSTQAQTASGVAAPSGQVTPSQLPLAAQSPFGATYNPAAAAAVAAQAQAQAAASAQATNQVAQAKTPHRGIIIAVLVSLGVVLVAGLAILLINFFGSSRTVSGTRTVMIYMLAGDLESSEAMASADLAELQATTPSSDTRVLVYTAGTSSWSNSSIVNGGVYEVGNGSLSRRTTLTTSNATSASALSAFIEYAVNNYAADLYDLIIWGRAGGATYGLGSDETSVSNTTLTLADITTALSDNQFGSSRTLEMIGFDAPLMASAETAAAFQDYSSYLVASEEVEPAAGWNYNYLSDVNRNTTSTELVSQIVASYATGFADDATSEQFWSLSAIDLSLFDELEAAADTLFAELATDLSWDNFSTFASAATQSTVFGYDGTTSADFVDLYALATAIGSTDLATTSAANNFTSILAKLVVANSTNITDAHGLSTYYITYNKPSTSASLAAASAVSWSQGYSNFLTAYARFASGNSQVESGSFVGGDASITNGTFSLELPTDLAANFERAKVYVWEQLGSNRYVKVYESSDVTHSGSILSTSDIDRQLYVADTLSGGSVTATEIRRDAGTTYYAIPVSLGAYTSSLVTRNATAIYKATEGSDTLTLVGLRLPTSNNLFAKDGTDLSNWSTMSFNVEAYYLLDDASDLTTPADTLASWGTSSSTQIYLSYDYALTFTDLDDGDYFVQFAVTDTQGNVHYSQLLAL